MCALLALAGVCLPAGAAEIEVLGQGSATSYLANAVDPGLGLAWTAPGFVEGSGWTDGVFGLGFETEPPGSGAHGLIATAVSPATRSIYTRTTFQLASAQAVTAVALDADYDDGIVAWLNGVEIYRSPGMRWVGSLTWDVEPFESHESSNAAEPDYTERDVTAQALGALVSGQNVLAIGVWNREMDDLVLAPRLVLDRPLLRGPYLQQGTAHSVVVRWRTAVPRPSRVWYGTTAGALDQLAESTALTVEHEIALEGLAPSTRYHYAIGGAAGELLAGGAGELFFETPSVTGIPRPTRLWVVGDSGWGNAAAERVREAYEATTGEAHTALWLMLGDNAYPFGWESNFQENLFEIYPELLARTVMWPTLGNHDGLESGPADWPSLDLFTLPAAGEAGGVASGTEQYYAFDWANAHVVVLDSMFSDRDDGAPMWDWLEADLAATSQEWILAIWHHPPYSKGGHDSDVDLESIEMREHALPLLESYGVDLVLTGHSHSYERSKLIDGHYGDSSTFDTSLVIDGGDGAPAGDGAYQAAGPGTVYAVAGSSSHVTAGSAVDLGGTGPNHPVMHLSLLELGSMVLEIDGNRLDGWFIDAEGEERDRFTLIKGAAPEPPVADFVGSPLTVAAGETVSFTDSSTQGPTWWGWDFDGNGSVDDQQPSPSHVYATPGAYTVSLAVSNSAGADVQQRTDYVCVTGGRPGSIEGLTLGPDKARVTWPVNPLATRYDVIRGDLIALHATGSFVGTGLACASSTVAPVWDDPALPAPGQGWYYLARGVNCVPEAGTYDETSSSQVAPRDAALQGAGAVCACPAGDDGDGDGYCSGVDNCPGVASGVLTDSDTDGAGDPCDLCPLDAADDVDDDGHCANADNCPVASNPGQLDFDGDGDGDACDADDDADGVVDFFDWFPLDPFHCNDFDDDDCDDCTSGTHAPGNDGVDTDTDGLCDAGDACTDVDADGFGNGTLGNAGCTGAGTDLDDTDPAICSDADADSCHDCNSGSWNPAADGPDLDLDGLCDAGDNCPNLPNPTQADLDLDGFGNPCDPCTDGDGDGFGNPSFPNLCFIDNCPDVSNPGQNNADGDAQGDVCDMCPNDNPNDTDTDFICNSVDNCPTVPNSAQLDFDLDGIGNLCDSCTDGDGDGFGDPGFPLNFCPPDSCPNDPGKSAPGVCGCGVPECWVPRDSGTSETIEGVDLQGTLAFAVGRDSTVLKSTDSGRTWIASNIGAHADLADVEFPADMSTGFVVGDDHVLLRTGNGGDTWTALSAPGTGDLRGICFPVDKTTGWVVGENGTILKTTDVGDTWVAQTSGTTATLEAVSFPFDKVSGWAVGRNGTILRTNDGGATWSPQTSGTTALLQSVTFRDHLHGFVVGDAHTVLKTIDGGAVWTPLPAPGAGGLNSVDFPSSPSVGWVVGDQGTILKTVDGGASWIVQPSGTGSTLRGVAVSFSGVGGIAVGQNGTVLQLLRD